MVDPRSEFIARAKELRAAADEIYRWLPNEHLKSFLTLTVLRPISDADAQLAGQHKDWRLVAGILNAVQDELSRWRKTGETYGYARQMFERVPTDTNDLNRLIEVMRGRGHDVTSEFRPATGDRILHLTIDGLTVPWFHVATLADATEPPADEAVFDELRAQGYVVDGMDTGDRATRLVSVDGVTMTIQRARRIADGTATMAEARAAARATE